MSSTLPPVPGPPPHGVRAMFVMRDVRRRWPFALRAALAMAVPVLVGWAAGNEPAGLMASIGGFTSLYGSGRPYLHRARLLGSVAVAFSLCVGIGIWAAAVPWLGVVTVAVLAVLATLMCNGLQVGPPGGYLLSLACASGTMLHQAHVSPARAGLLVLSGGALSWVLHMASALWAPRAPEMDAVEDAADAVAGYLRAVGTSAADRARHLAASALHQTWAVLVNEQPVRPHPDSTLSRLRTLNRALHVRFAEGLEAAAAGRAVPEALTDEVGRLGAMARRPPRLRPALRAEELPLGRPGPLELLREALAPGSSQRRVLARVGVAALLAGALAAGLGIERAYWATAAAVLVLHQGFDWLRTLQRGLERTVGTVVGLVIALGVLAVDPHGGWLAVTLFVLQFAIEMLVLRNYALAVMLITPSAITIASGGRHVADPASLLLARGVDTLLGCVVAFAVYAVSLPWSVESRLPDAVAGTVDAARDLLPWIAAGSVSGHAAREARQVAARRAMGLVQAYDAAVGSSAGRRRAAEGLWPAVLASQRLVYRLLAACWALEQLGDRAAREAAAAQLSPPGALIRSEEALAALAEAARHGSPTGPLGDLPPFLRPDVAMLRDCLVPQLARAR